MTDYANGFKDGFAAGLEEGKKIVEEQWRHDKIKEIEKSLPKLQPNLGDYMFRTNETWPNINRCSKCGISLNNVMNYTCSSINCPNYLNTTRMGAIGSDTTSYTYGASANGPEGNLDEGLLKSRYR